MISLPSHTGPIVRICPKCGPRGALTGKTSGAGPVQPFRCDRCHLLYWDVDFRAALSPATETAPNPETDR